MRKLAAVAVVLAIAGTTACKKTGEGEYEVQRPTMGMEADTIQMPTVGTTRDTIVGPPRPEIRP